MLYLNDSRRVTFLSDLSAPTGVAVYKRKLYYADGNYESVTVVNVKNSTDKTTLRSNLPELETLKVFEERHNKSEMLLIFYFLDTL